MTKIVSKRAPIAKRCQGRSRKSLYDAVMGDLRNLKIKNWKVKPKNRQEWKTM